MAEIEDLVRLSATALGVVALSAPILSVFRQSRRLKGRSSGVAAGSRTWPGVLLIAVGFFGAGFLLWRPIPLQLPDFHSLLLSLAGAALYFPGVSLYLWGLVTIGSQFGVSGLLGAELYQEHQLITRGPFAIIRHPMYAGVLLAAIGGFLIFRTWAMVVFLPMSLVVTARAEREEKLLEGEFGEAWKNYVANVPKWFPRL
jgi:protein-S-isoprenylcysteine O-methyltransferase Ste14